MNARSRLFFHLSNALDVKKILGRTNTAASHARMHARVQRYLLRSASITAPRFVRKRDLPKRHRHKVEKAAYGVANNSRCIGPLSEPAQHSKAARYDHCRCGPLSCQPSASEGFGSQIGWEVTGSKGMGICKNSRPPAECARRKSLVFTFSDPCCRRSHNKPSAGNSPRKVSPAASSASALLSYRD